MRWFLIFILLIAMSPASAFGEEKEKGTPNPAEVPTAVEPAEAKLAQSAHEPLDISMMKHTQQTPNKSKITLMPFIGIGGFFGSGSMNEVSNTITIGAAVDFPLTSPLSIEAEGSYGENSVRAGYGHNYFDQFNMGASLMLSKTFQKIRPFAGGGFVLSYYNRLSMFGHDSDKWIGSGKVTAGAVYQISRSIGIGIRGALLFPMLFTNNSYTTLYSGYMGNPLKAINDNSFQLLGTVAIEL